MTGSKRRLSARLGNDELAGDALQDAYLKLDGVAAPEAVRQPGPIYRMAFHIAADYARSGDERLTRAEADEILGLTPDAAPGPAQIAEDRQALHTLMRALERMPERQREILLAAPGTASRKRSWRRGMAFRYAWWSASCSTRSRRAPAVFKVGSMIFSRYFKSGAKALDSRPRPGCGASSPGRPRGATRWRCGNGARSDAHAAAFERARRLGGHRTGRQGVSRRIRARRRRAGAPGGARCCCARAWPGPARQRPPPAAAAGLVSLDWARTTARRWASSARSTGAAAGRGRTGRPHPHEWPTARAA